MVPCLLLFGSLSSNLISGQPTLKQLHVVTRHGARTPLEKEADTLLEPGDVSVLTPLGRKQLYDLGVWLRNTYNTNDFLDLYQPSLDRLESSNLDRTITSANSLSRGLFPLHSQEGGNRAEIFQSLLPEMPSIPVYSRQEQNDVYLRSYHHCPTFHDNLQELYQSVQWTTVETNYQSILRKVSQVFNLQETVALKDLWSYYDQIHVAKTECEHDMDSFACRLLPDPSLATALTDTEFSSLEKVAERAEEMKFGRGNAGNLLGSNLLWLILSRAADEGRFFLYSAHAPTILGLLSTIQEWAQDDFFVEYGSAIIVEVYQDQSDESRSLKFLYKSSNSDVARPLQLKHANCAISSQDYAGHCDMTKFEVWATKNTIVTNEAWCEECGNEVSDVCMAHLLQKNTLEQEIRESGSEPMVVAGSFMGGFAAALFTMVLCHLCCRLRKTQGVEKDGSEDTVEQAPITEMDLVEDLQSLA